ncbi:hypothetical protein GY26_18620, partial [Gammaproteobacteria bacterium MFB021]
SLEIASGSEDLARHLAEALPGLRWQPSVSRPEALPELAAWRAHAAPPNPFAPLAVDDTAEWPEIAELAAVCAFNLVHIAPWAVAEALFAGAGRQLPPGGLLVLYGPFKRAETPLAASNARFDEALRARDPRWGIRDLTALEALAAAAGLEALQVHEMPANNLCLVWRRAAQA